MKYCYVRLVTGDDDGYIVFWSLEKCLDSQCGRDCLSYRSHNTYVEGHTSGLALVGPCLLLSSSGKSGQLTIHDYWRAAVQAEWSTSMSRTVPRNCFAGSLMP